MPPVPSGTASCIACARKRTSGSASSKRSALGGDERGVFAQAVAGEVRRHRAAALAPRAPAGHAGDEHQRLRVHGLVQRSAGPSLAMRPEVDAGDRVRLAEGLLDDGQVGEALHHADATGSPGPGKTMASVMSHSVLEEHGAPGEAAAHALQQHEVAGLARARRARRRRARAAPRRRRCWRGGRR